MTDRPQLADAQRIVVKVGSSSLTGRRGLDGDRLQSLVDSLAALRRAGKDVVLVSSGAVAAGSAKRMAAAAAGARKALRSMPVPSMDDALTPP